MTRKKAAGGIGSALMHNQQATIKSNKQRLKAGDAEELVPEKEPSKSVLDQNNLEEILANVQVRSAEYNEMNGFTELAGGPILLSTIDVKKAERVAASRREVLSIPRRPKWSDDMSNKELEELENQAFVDWRREIAHCSQDQGLHLTPYEKNLDFWRQLWRTIERSDLLVQILDARDPDFYHCRDLARYIAEVDGSKRLMLLVNKSDFLTRAQRKRWAEYYAENNIDAIFFSALHELAKQAGDPNAFIDYENFHLKPVPGLDDDDDLLSDEENEKGESSSSAAKPADAEEDEVESPLGVLTAADTDVVDCTHLVEELISRLKNVEPAKGRNRTCGFVGYPNVGKSTVINALIGAKKVGMSSRPGKTKHIQTMDLKDEQITLCDCPGLVFPSVVASRAHLVINNTVPLEDLIDCWEPMRLIVEKVGYDNLCERYKCSQLVKEAVRRSGQDALDEVHSFLAAYAVRRQHFLRAGVPDEQWAARKILRNFVKGELLYCEPPPGTSIDVKAEEAHSAAVPLAKPASAGYPNSSAVTASTEKEQEGSADDDEEFGDLGEFLENNVTKEKRVTKRAMRAMNKQVQKGKAPTATQTRGKMLGAC